MDPEKVKHLYTRRGDKGETGMFSGERVEKESNRVEALGTIDEFNASLGVAKVHSSPYLASIIDDLQERNLFLASEIATLDKNKVVKPVIPENIESIETIIDDLMAKMPPAKYFVIPGRSQSAAFLHVSRTVIRRAERAILRLAKNEEINPELLRYVNRLSDLMFAMARYANIIDGDGDEVISREGRLIQKRDHER